MIGAAEAQLMLGLARPDGDSAAADLADVSLSALQDRLTRFRVLGLFGSRLLDRAAGMPIDDGFRGAVLDEISRTRDVGEVITLATWTVVQVLADHGVQAVPFKGPALAERLHGDLGLRSSRDVDLLVALDDLDASVEALRPLGYQVVGGETGVPLFHHKLEAPGGVPVELHWRIHWNDTVHPGAMLARTHRSEGIPELSLTDDLLALLLVYARDGLIGLRAPADIAAWWARYADRFDPEDFTRTVSAYPRLVPSISAAAMMVELVVGVPLVRYLPAAGRGRRRTELAVRIAGHGALEDTGELDTVPKAVDGLLVTAPGFGAFLHRTLVPPLAGEGRQLAINRVLYDLWLTRRLVALAGRTARRRAD